MVKALIVVVVLVIIAIVCWQGAALFIVKEDEVMCGTRHHAERFRRVVSGDEANPGDWPWLVFIKGIGCSGVLVDKEWVFTAGHCIYVYPRRTLVTASDIEVIAGAINTESYVEEIGFQNRSVEAIYLHPQYRREVKVVNYDFALLKLDKPFTINANVSPICLPDPEVTFEPGTSCYVAGWGKTVHRDQDIGFFGPDLMFSDVELRSPDECRQYFGNVSKFEETIFKEKTKICAGAWDEQWKGPCRGDSGSPLVCEDPSSGLWHLHGIVSHGRKCGEVAAYTKVTAMMDFANTVMGKSSSTVFLGEDVTADKFICESGEEIPIVQNCDGHTDCNDTSDESRCECTAEEFRCPDGACRPLTDRCNINEDCSDGSDEHNCEYFTCASGRNISLDKVCDANLDCKGANKTDYSDEIDCKCNNASQFRCPSGKCIPKNWRCDGEQDCDFDDETTVLKIVAADEINCECQKDTHIECNNKRCVHASLRCDGMDDCRDGTDENDCRGNTCHDPNSIYCWPIGICILYDHCVCSRPRLREVCSNRTVEADSFLGVCTGKDL